MTATTSAPDPVAILSSELGLPSAGLEAVAKLLAEGGTVPFIARYRKEATGALDEVQIAAIRDGLERLEVLSKRRAAILNSLEERELLTSELSRLVSGAKDLSTLEDIYRPYRPKRRTRATIARERGLEPLAARLLAQEESFDPMVEAKGFIDPDGEVPDVDSALAGARDIIAEQIADDAACRKAIKERLEKDGVIASRVARGKQDDPASAKFRDYFDFSEPLPKSPSHRILAIFRGERAGALSLSIRVDEELALSILERAHLKKKSRAGEQVRLAIADGYTRLLAPSLETEARALLKDRADTESIAVFAGNLRELLLAAPLGSKNILALDPGFRSGCKLVCLDRRGDLLEHTVVFPHSGDRQRTTAGAAIVTLCKKHEVEAIAIGNGTASRETESFVRELDLPSEVPIVLVNESGASIYSASEVAREEFPDLDLTVRGAISIGRRLMDPLAELVKLDPQSIGVGQYQHDVDQKALARALDDVVMSCVNRVGIDVNTASAQLLSYVAGVGPQIARNIVHHRSVKPFTARTQLKKVARLGPKAFEQCAGFLRIPDAKNPLDRSAVHPESYGIVESMAGSLSCGVEDLIADANLRDRIDLPRHVTDRVGIPTLEDIISELSRPGRDPRAEFEVFAFAVGVEAVEDLIVGQTLPGIVTNVAAFGAFVDVGVHQDGLVHVSQLADRFVRDPAEVVKVGQRVLVRVLEVDLPRQRIGLSLKGIDPPV